MQFFPGNHDSRFQNFSILLLLGLLLIFACGPAYAATQNVTVSPTPTTVTAGSPLALTVSHSTSDNCQNISGVALKIFFNSSLLTFNSFANIYFSSFPTRDDVPKIDSANEDGDGTTDKFVVIGWADISNLWPTPDDPGTITLVTLNFTANAGQFGTASVNIKIDPTSLANDCTGTDTAYTPVGSSAVVTIPDATPPVAANAVIFPNSVFQGTSIVTLTADATDAAGIAAGEYSVGSNAATGGSGTPMDAQDGIFGGTAEVLTADIDTTGLAVGTYTYWVRAKDTGGNWGNAVSATLTVQANQAPVASNVTVSPVSIVEGFTSVTLTATLTDPDAAHTVQAVEYYIDTDPGEGNGTAIGITAANSVSVNGSAGTSALAQGNHQIYIRGQDSMGKWGIPVAAALTVTACDAQADFSYTPTTAVVGQPVTFGNTSTGALASTATYDWDFGDGTVNNSVAGNVSQTHTYTSIASGLTVSLKAYGTSPCTTTATQTIDVICDVTAGFTTDKTLTNNEISIVLDDTVNFTDTSAGSGTYAWSFGDGGTDTTAGNVFHQYTTEGSFTASLTLTGASGCTSQQQIIVNVLPCDVTAAFEPSATLISMGDTVTFTNTSSGTLTGATFDWDFDGNGTADVSGAGTEQQSHTFSAAGEQTVILTAYGSTGCSTTFETIIYVNDPACAGVLDAAITANPAVIQAGETVSFTDATTGSGTPTSWSWDADGDGTGDYNIQNPSHTYLLAGSYTVTLTVSDGTCTAFAQTGITADCDVTAGLSASTTSVTSGGSVTFSNTSTGTAAASATYEWDFNGDGTADQTTTGLAAPSAYRYNTSGTYNASVTATGAGGCTSQANVSIFVRQSYSYVPPPPVTNTSPVLKISTNGNDVTLSWTSVSGARGYKLLYAPWPDGTPMTEKDMGTATSYKPPFPPGTEYYIAVKPDNNTDGWSDMSAVLHLYMPTAFPAPELSLETEGNIISLSWTAVQQAGGYTLYYAPYPDMAPIAQADMGKLTELSGPLPPGSAFYAAVQGYKGNIRGELSNIEYFIIPAISEAPVLTNAVSENTVNLSWTRVSGADGYKLLFSPFPTDDIEGSLDLGNTTGLPPFTLPPGSAYYVAIQGYNQDGVSEMSNREVVIIPAQLQTPTLYISRSHQTVSLTWTSVANASGYTLYYLNASGTKIGGIDMKNQRKLALTLSKGSAFYATVQAYNAEGKSGFSNIEHFEIPFF